MTSAEVSSLQRGIGGPHDAAVSHVKLLPVFGYYMH
jgi:hypothetical protein